VGAGYLPRPAFGRRPWLAFFLRARSLRRFAFAMAGERNRMDGESVIGLCVPGWGSGPLLVGATRWRRWRGLRPRPEAAGVLLRARSVHTFGMQVPLTIVSLDAAGVVRRTARLRPRRIFLDLHARWIVELPPDRDAPQVGVRLRVRPMLGGCPGP
jgi:hypothetical protein